MRRPKSQDFILHPGEEAKGYQRLEENFIERFQPQDAFEYEFVRQLLSALWQRARFEYFDVVLWETSSRRADQNGAAFLIASGSLESITLQRSRFFGMAQDRNAQSFHRTARSWMQSVVKQRPGKTNEPK